MTRIHLDTDIGGDMDDLCALAMLLKLPDVELTGVTTVAEEQGRRAGYVRYLLDLLGRGDIPFAAGADTSDGYYRYPTTNPRGPESGEGHVLRGGSWLDTADHVRPSARAFLPPDGRDDVTGFRCAADGSVFP